MKIGPSFDKELRDAGAHTVPVIYEPDKGVVSFPNGVPEADRAKVLAVLAAHDPKRPGPPPKADNDPDNLPKPLLALLMAVASLTGKTPAQAKAAFIAAWNSLP